MRRKFSNIYGKNVWFSFLIAAIAICPNRNRRVAAVAVPVIHTHVPVPSHTSAEILATHVIAHYQKVPKTDITQDQARQKIMAAQMDHQTEMKAWMIKLTRQRYYVTIIKKHFRYN